MKWNAKHEGAALDVAEDILSDVKIAEAAGVTKRTLETWKREPEFQHRVKEYFDALAIETERYGIARRCRRIARLNGDYKALQQIVLDRAAFYAQQRREAEERIMVLEASLMALEASRYQSEALAESLNPEHKEAEKSKRKAEWLAGEAERERQSVCFRPGMDTGWLLPQYKQHGIDIVLDAGTEAALRALEQQAAKELGQWEDKSKVEHDFTKLSDAELIALAKSEIVAEAKSAAYGDGASGTDSDPGSAP